MDIGEILKLKFPGIDLIFKVRLQNDGQGTYISQWDDSLGHKPDADILAKWELEMAPVKAELDVRQARRDNYPAMGDQLDALYKAMDAGVLPKIDGFYVEIKAVKERFPKP